MRQKPRLHTVKEHRREGKPVHSYRRGIYKPIQIKKRDYVPSYLEGTDYLPGTNIPIRWESMGGPETTTKVWMTPEEYLGYTTPPDYSKEGFSMESIKSLTEVLTKKGEVLYSPYLTVRYRDNQVTGHEGRHRAYWAMLQGIPKIPVYIVWDDSTGHFAGKRKTKFGKLKPQGFYEREKLGPRYETHGFYSALDVAEGIPIHMFKAPEKPQVIVQKDLPKIEFTPEQRLRFARFRAMREERARPENLCPECAGQRTIKNYVAGTRVCLDCGKEFIPTKPQKSTKHK